MVAITALWVPGRILLHRLPGHVGARRRGRSQVRPLRRRRPGWADPSSDDLTRSLRRPAGAARAVPNLLGARGRGM